MTPAEFRDCRSGGRRPTAVPPSFRGGVLPYSRASLSFVRELTYSVYLLAALSNRAGHYIFALWFLSIFFLSFFPHLFSAVADWISTILPHMVWP